MIYKGYTIECHGTGKYFVCLGQQGMLFCRSLEEAQTFVDYLIKKVCYT